MHLLLGKIVRVPEKKKKNEKKISREVTLFFFSTIIHDIVLGTWLQIRDVLGSLGFQLVLISSCPKVLPAKFKPRFRRRPN